MRLAFLLFLFLSNHTYSYAVAAQNNDQKKVAEIFLEKIINGKEQEAIRGIFSRLRFLESRKQEIDLAILNTEHMISKLGKVQGFAFSREEELSPNVHRYIYQVFYNQQPIHLSMILHKVQNEWFVIKFNFSDKLTIISPLSNSNHNTSSKPMALTKEVMSKYVKQNFTDSLSKSPINCNIFNASFINNQNKQLNYLIGLFGKPIGYDLVSRERISSNNNRFIYFLNLENYPVTITFDMYLKPNGNWCAINYNFNDQFSGIEAVTPQ